MAALPVATLTCVVTRFARRKRLTGLWQVSGRADLPWEEAVRLDLRYVENWSLSLDLVILLRTLSAVCRASGAYQVALSMTETVLAPASDAAFARWLADRAGDALLALRETRGFADPDGLKADGDRISHELLLDELARWRPADAVLSEEGVRDGADRQAADRVWIIDPLDGTREYSEPGRTDWAVHVALWRRTAGSRPADGRPDGSAGELVAGAVALPAQHVTLGTDAPPAYPPLTGDRIRLAASRSRPPSFLASLATELDAELVPMGSAGNKVAAVVQGKVDAYVHAGGQYEWDSAAPVAVAKATGLYASRIDGSALDYNRLNPRLPDLLVCRRDLADELTAALARLGVGRDD